MVMVNSVRELIVNKPWGENRENRMQRETKNKRETKEKRTKKTKEKQKKKN